MFQYFEFSLFIDEDDNEEDSEIKLRRKDIANEMWKSYLNYTANTETSDGDDDFSGLEE